MLSLIASAVLAPQSGVLVVDRLGIGYAQNGQWRSLDSAFSDKWPKQTVASATIAKLTSGSCFLLGDRQSISSNIASLSFVGDDGGPGDRGWILSENPKLERAVVWFGPKPIAPKATFASNSSAVYIQAVRDYLRAKGLKNTKPLLQAVVLADLDGNGTNEALIFASSRPTGDMPGTFTLTGETKFPNDFSLAFVRYVSGKTVKTAELYYSDGRKSSVEGVCRFAGLWNLDGKPGLEIIYRWQGWEAWSGVVAEFAKGKVTKLAEAGDGA